MSNTLVLGRQPIDLSIYAKVAAHEAKLQEGVANLDCGRFGFIPQLRRCGVRTRLDREGNLHLTVSVVVRYGADARKVAAAVQTAVLRGVGRIADRPVGAVDVAIRGFEVVMPERSLYERSATA